MRNQVYINLSKTRISTREALELIIADDDVKDHDEEEEEDSCRHLFFGRLHRPSLLPIHQGRELVSSIVQPRV